jgi:hypothetical protein
MLSAKSTSWRALRQSPFPSSQCGQPSPVVAAGPLGLDPDAPEQLKRLQDGCSVAGLLAGGLRFGFRVRLGP